MKNLLKSIIKYYKSFAIIILNTIVLLILLNVVLWILFNIRQDIVGPFVNVNPKLYKLYLDKEYPNMTIEEKNTLLMETWGWYKHIYEPYIQFKEEPHSGKYVNVDNAGFRKSSNQCSWPSQKGNFNIFVFGGSTTFGYGVKDTGTIPSKIQEKLDNKCKKVCVYNFAQSQHFSSQERVFFEKLLTEGHQPDMVIFIDGLNDYFYIKDEPKYTETIRNYFKGTDYLGNFKDVSIIRLVSYINKKISTEQILSGNVVTLKNASNTELIAIADRIFLNQKLVLAISDSLNIKTLFVIQPIPFYKYNLSYHFGYNATTLLGDSWISPHHERGYSILAKQYLSLSKEQKNNILWLADIQEDKKENLYVDGVHYTAQFSDEIAENIVRYINNYMPLCIKK